MTISFWLVLLAAGGKACWFAPVRAGFRSLGIVKADSKVQIGDLRLPCLELSGPSASWLLFPQLTVDARKAYYRLDVLARFSCEGRGWVNIEIDGPGYDPRFDDERQRLLNLPTLRINRQELGTAELLGLMERKLMTITARRNAS